MKKIILLIVCGLFLISCGENQALNGNRTTSGAASKSGNETGKSTSVQTNDPPVLNPAAKIEKEEEITFQPEGFPAGWEWIDPDRQRNPTSFELKPGLLHIELPPDKDLFEENRTAPRLLKKLSGDFEIETRLNFEPKYEYQGAGILVFRNDSNYLRLERAFGGVNNGGSGIRFDEREDEVYVPITTPDKSPTFAKVVELKMRRVGQEFTSFWREPGGEWKVVGKYVSGYPETVQVGLIGCNTATKIPVEFSYIKLAPVAK